MARSKGGLSKQERHDDGPSAPRCAGCNGPTPLGHPDWLCDDCTDYKASLPIEGDDYPHEDEA